MRQAGVIAAAGIVAIERCRDWIQQHHANARRLWEGLAEIDGVATALAPRATNMAFMDVSALGWDTPELVARLKEIGVLVNPRPSSRVRLTTHRCVSADDVEYVIETVGSMMSPSAFRASAIRASAIRASA